MNQNETSKDYCKADSEQRVLFFHNNISAGQTSLLQVYRCYTDVTSMLPDLPHLTWRTLSNRNLRLAGFRTTLYSAAEFLKLVWGPPDPPRPPSPLKINSQFDDSEII